MDITEDKDLKTRILTWVEDSKGKTATGRYGDGDGRERITSAENISTPSKKSTSEAKQSKVFSSYTSTIPNDNDLYDDF